MSLAIEPAAMIALLIGGVFAGVINSMAGGGSLITLPLLILAGLPPTVANASNRVAIVVQCFTAVAGFDGWFSKKKKSDSGTGEKQPEAQGIPWSVVRRALFPILLGSTVGAALASRISDELFRPILGVILLVMGAALFFSPNKWMPNPGDPLRAMTPAIFLAFLATGFYGGFLQAGVGFMLLAALVPGLGLDLVRANGVKVALVFLLTLMALGIFAYAGQVNWGAGGVLAIGNGLGGYLGARLAIRVGSNWIRWILFVMIVLFALEILGVRSLIGW